MRTSITILVVLFYTCIAESAEPAHIPLPGQVIRYEREQPVFKSTHITKERGNALLTLLDSGRVVKRWIVSPRDGCVLPVPARLQATLTLTDGTTYRIGVSHDGGLLYLPEGLFVFTDLSAKQSAAKWMADMESDLRREVIDAPKPCVYKIGTVDDGYTLSGVARLFYGDASKWRQIYEANRAVLKSPDQISGAERLTIPKL